MGEQPVFAPVGEQPVSVHMDDQVSALLAAQPVSAPVGEQPVKKKLKQAP